MLVDFCYWNYIRLRLFSALLLSYCDRVLDCYKVMQSTSVLVYSFVRLNQHESLASQDLLIVISRSFAQNQHDRLAEGVRGLCSSGYRDNHPHEAVVPIPCYYPLPSGNLFQYGYLFRSVESILVELVHVVSSRVPPLWSSPSRWMDLYCQKYSA